ncbi:hypothetical protein LPJ53_000551 [Coemansia erecta]|uniref:INSIG-domain-containing protein n=1 Tax=Coemansia erecta TaxID=147472 RepID=A0A9W7Y7I2_9FUNG|nr:hypothetical protein LPJ53_000551 [Coemansia erecta]
MYPSNSACSQRTNSADGESDDSGELWISPKISRAATLQSEPRESADTLLSQVAALRHVHSETARSTSTPMPTEKQRVHTRRKAHVRKQRQQQQRQQDDMPELSLARVIAWYVPRVVLLFLIGWVCSAGVQLIHAQQQQRADSSDSSDSDETDGEFPYESLFGWQTAGSGDLTRDLIGRVLAQAAWSNGISGLLTVLVGLMYPYVDYKWRGSSQRPHVDWYSILRCVGGFLGVNYAALKLPFESANQSALILIIISMGLWTVCDGTLRGWLLSMNAALMATWLLYVHALTNLDSLFTRDDYLRLLSCLPSVLFTYCLMAGIIGRRLASKSPLWSMHLLPSTVELAQQRSLGTVSSSASGFI